MKALNFLVLILLLTTASFAGAEGNWNCQGYGQQNSKRLAKLKFIEVKFDRALGVLNVPRDEFCQVGSGSVIENCTFDGHHLSIGQKVSLFETSDRRVILLLCGNIEPQGGVGGSN